MVLFGLLAVVVTTAAACISTASILIAYSSIFLLVGVEGHSIRLLTWNLLAPIYATPAKYPSVACSQPQPQPYADDLDWKTTRQTKIINTLLQSQADLICLQEVQLDLWDDFWKAFCRADAAGSNNNNNNHDDNKSWSCSYTAVVQNVTRQHPVACAILIKQPTFHVVRVESRSRACLVVLEETTRTKTPTTSTSATSDNQRQHTQGKNTASHSIHNNTTIEENHKKRLYLATVHLEAGLEKQDTRWNQIKSLLKRCYRHMELDVSSSQSTTSKSDNDDSSYLTTSSSSSKENNNRIQNNNVMIARQPLILAGDFNMWTRQCTLYHTLAGMETDNYLGILHRRHPTHDSTNINNNNDAKRTTLSWQTLLPLRNVHQHDRPLLTYAGGSVLDYCWTRNLERCQPYWPLPQPLENLDVDDCFPDCSRHTVELIPAQAWPSQQVPSDHLPIGMEFCL